MGGTVPCYPNIALELPIMGLFRREASRRPAQTFLISVSSDVSDVLASPKSMLVLGS
jgi:hypothetical protein